MMGRSNYSDNNSLIFSCSHDHAADVPLSLERPAKINYTILVSIAITTSLITTVLITLFLLVLYRFKKLRHRANLLLMMLSISDLMNTVLVLPLYSLQLILLIYDQLICDLSQFIKLIAYLSTIMSITAITLITFNLFLGTVRPYLYSSMDVFTMIKGLIAVWILFIISAVICMYGVDVWDIFVTIINIIAVILFLVMCGLHMKVGKETRKISTFNSSVYATVSPAHRKTLRLASTVLLIFGLTYAPTIILVIYQIAKGSNVFIKSFLDRWSDVIALSNPLWNSLLYCYRLQSVRKRMFRILFGAKVKEERPSPMTEATA